MQKYNSNRQDFAVLEDMMVWKEEIETMKRSRPSCPQCQRNNRAPQLTLLAATAIQYQKWKESK